jgi:signal transduction histidine kinase
MVFLCIYLTVSGVLLLLFVNSLQIISYIFFAMVMLIAGLIKDIWWSFLLLILFGIISETILFLQVSEKISYNYPLIDKSYWGVLIPMFLVIAISETSHNLNLIVGHRYLEAKKTAIEITKKNLELEKRIERRERQIEESHYNEIKSYQVNANYGGIFSPMLHDISTPLSTALGAMILVEDNPSDVKYLEASLDQLKDIYSQTDNILDGFGDEPELVNVGEVVDRIDSILDSALLKEGIRISYDDLENTYIFISKISFERVCINLLLNSIDALKEIKDKRGKVICISASESNGSVRVTFEDNGIGMSSEIVERAFDHGLTNKNSNSNLGIGLSYVRSEVEKFDGDIKVESLVGEYTKVELTFPIRSS